MKRGCGRRVPGGAYLVTELSKDPRAKPIDSFLFCPPWVPVDKEDNAIYPNPLGLHAVEHPTGIYHVWDWIGETYYPYFPDFWEEVRRYGLSRRISSTADFNLLSKQSQIVGFHKKGYISADTNRNFQKRYLDAVTTRCPHDNTQPHTCVSHLWSLVDQAMNENEQRDHLVRMPRGEEYSEFIYAALKIPYWMWDDEYDAHWVPAAMFHLPIHKIEVVEDTIGGSHEIAIENLENSITNVPYVLVKE